MGKKGTTILLLRIGLAFVFTYAAIAAFLNPSAWIGFFPTFIRDIFPDSLLLSGFSIAELVIAVLLFFKKTVFYTSLASAILLLGMILFNLGSLDIVFRDVGLLFAALSLAVATKEDPIKDN